MPARLPPALVAPSAPSQRRTHPTLPAPHPTSEPRDVLFRCTIKELRAPALFLLSNVPEVCVCGPRGRDLESGRKKRNGSARARRRE